MQAENVIPAIIAAAFPMFAIAIMLGSLRQNIRSFVRSLRASARCADASRKVVRMVIRLASAS